MWYDIGLDAAQQWWTQNLEQISNSQRDSMYHPHKAAFGVRHQPIYVPSQWKTLLHCNDVSYWLSAYLDSFLWCVCEYFREHFIILLNYNTEVNRSFFNVCPLWWIISWLTQQICDNWGPCGLWGLITGIWVGYKADTIFSPCHLHQLPLDKMAAFLADDN